MQDCNRNSGSGSGMPEFRGSSSGSGSGDKEKTGTKPELASLKIELLGFFYCEFFEKIVKFLKKPTIFYPKISIFFHLMLYYILFLMQGSWSSYIFKIFEVRKFYYYFFVPVPVPVYRNSGGSSSGCGCGSGVLGRSGPSPAEHCALL